MKSTPHIRLRTVSTIIVSVLVVLTVAALIRYFYNRGNKTDDKVYMVTSYEDKDGWVYTCSRPVKAKNQGATYGNGTPSPTPIDPAEAAKYCTRQGIE